MPKTQVRFYQYADGRAPMREWLRELHQADPRPRAKCVAQIERLAEAGHELRLPEADVLRGGIPDSGRAREPLARVFALDSVGPPSAARGGPTRPIPVRG